jgi:hypothetical protein
MPRDHQRQMLALASMMNKEWHGLDGLAGNKPIE